TPGGGRAPNPHTPPPRGAPPRLARVVLRVVPENAAQVTELRSGGADLILSPRATDLADLAQRPGMRTLVRPSRKYVFIGWNGKRPPFRDPRVRRALALALDRERMLRALRAGYGTLATGPIAPDHWAHDPALAPLPFAPDSARALLAAAGYCDRDGDGTVEDAAGRPLRFEMLFAARNDFNRDAAELIRAQLAAVGVQAVPRFLDFAALIGLISSPERRFDAVFMSFESDFKLDLREQFHSAEIDGPFQLASYRNPEVDRLLDSTAVITDRARALPLWHRLERILLAEQPWAVLWYAPDLYAARTRLQGLDMDVRGTFVNLPRWHIEEATTPAAAATTPATAR
ncbi:MAG: hypothetical protein IRZ00_18710, partial [Gemmatimonadetes bacterium]|nr:hypothetical protein [Gemmatimonadota bacterium]